MIFPHNCDVIEHLPRDIYLMMVVALIVATVGEVENSPVMTSQPETVRIVAAADDFRSKYRQLSATDGRQVTTVCQSLYRQRVVYEKS